MKKNAVLLAITLLFLTLSPALAADPSTEKHWTGYTKAGWFVWDEQIAGREFIKDEGMLYAFGVTRTDTVYKALRLSETFELWGGHPEYDGEQTFSGEEMHETNFYIGTREEIRASVRVVETGRLSVDPFIGIAHKLWFRAQEGELWNFVYAPIGLRGEHTFGKNRSFFVEGGMTLPLYTANRWFGKNQGDGYEDITLKPNARIGHFAEAGLRFDALSISLAYEATKFDKSDLVATESLDGTHVVHMYQPDSSTSTTWLKLSYNF